MEHRKPPYRREQVTLGFTPARDSAGLEWRPSPQDLFSLRWTCGCMLEQYRNGEIPRTVPCLRHDALLPPRAATSQGQR